VAEEQAPLPSRPILDVSELPFALSKRQEEMLKNALGIEGRGKLTFRLAFDEVYGVSAGADVGTKFGEHVTLGAEAGWSQKGGVQAQVVGQIVWEPEPEP